MYSTHVQRLVHTFIAIAILLTTTTVGRAQATTASVPADYFTDVVTELKKEWPKNRTIRFVFHGHSVPAGYFKTPTIQRFDSYPHLFQQALCKAYPTAPIDVSVTAMGGENSQQGAKRFGADVLNQKPDVVFIDYCLNDRRIGLDTARATWSHMIELCQAAGVKVVLLTPTPETGTDILDDASPLAQHAEQVRRLGAKFGVPVVDSYTAFRSRAAAGTPITTFLSQSNHPNRLGHEIVGRLLLELFSPTAKQTAQEETSMQPLSPATAEEWAQLVLKGVDTEFPNKLALVYSNPTQIKTPREHFPAFYGCFDWHSSVHGHWVLVRLLKRYPNIAAAPRIRQVLAEHLSAANLQHEADFFAQEEQKSFERMYGWAWLLRLAIELDGWDDPDAKQWREHLRPLERILVQRIEAYLPLLTVPIRTGEHPDTAFALGQILDYARAMQLPQLEALVLDRSRAFYHSDRDYPVHYEPSGQDFFSSCWNEADLMRRVLPQAKFTAWLAGYLPRLSSQLTDGTIAPVSVSDPTDGKLVHLAGLNLHRAWCMRSVAHSLPPEHLLRQPLQASARSHLAAGLQYINSGHYEGDHWLATFGLYTIEGIGL